MKKNIISFKWQLPQSGNQEIKGIITDNGRNNIFYKMYFMWDVQSLFYSAYNVNESNRQIMFMLILENKTCNYKTPPCKTLEISTVNDSILDTSNIIIHKDVLNDFIDANRYFQIKFKLID